jgi:hypothetical protein
MLRNPCQTVSSVVCASGHSGGAGPEPVATATDIYLRPDGSDSNSGLSPSSPKRTLQAALDLFPTFTAADVRLHIDGTPATPYNIDNILWPHVLFANQIARVWILGDGGGSGTIPYEELATGTVAATVVAQFEFDIGVAPGDDAWAGAAILFTSGAAAGQYKSVNYNEGTTVRLAAGAPFAPGDTFRVVRSAVRFETTRVELTIPGAGTGSLNYLHATNFLAWVNVGFDYVGASRCLLALAGTHYFLGVCTSLGVYINPVRELMAGDPGTLSNVQVDFSQIGPLAPVVRGFVGWGLQQVLGDPDVFNDGGLFVTGRIDGTWVVTRINVTGGSYVFVIGGRCRRLELSDLCEVRLGTSNWFFARGASAEASVLVQNGALMNVFNGARVDNTGNGNLFTVRRQARLQLDSGAGDSGAAAVGFGIDAQDGGQVIITGVPQYTGVAGDTRVDSVIRANAFYSGPGVGEANVITGSRIVRVNP